MIETSTSPGRSPRVRPNALHTFDSFLGGEGEVTDRRTIDGREGLRLRFDDARTTWLPADRCEDALVAALERAGGRE